MGKDNNEKLQQKMAEMMHIQEKDNKAPDKEGDTSVCCASRALSGAILDRHIREGPQRENIILRFLIICFCIPTQPQQ